MTEKDYAPQKKESKRMVVRTPKEKAEKQMVKKEVKEKVEIPTSEEKLNEKKEEKKKPIVKKEIVKRDFAVVNGTNIPVSTKHSKAICKFIRGKNINEAIEYLEEVIRTRKAISMKGEIPHRKGNMMSGRFPKKASQEFIKLLRSLGANANANGLEEVIISEAIANIGVRPYGRFGRTRKKRTHIMIKCREKKEKIKPEEKKK